MYLLISRSDLIKQAVFALFALFVAVLASVSILKIDIAGPIILVFASVLVVYLIFLFKNPMLGLITLIIYCFLSGLIGREIMELPSGVIEGLLITTWLAVIFASKSKDFQSINNDFCILILIWF